jgi:hypothetical protein
MERKDNSSDGMSDETNEGERPDVALAMHAHVGRESVAGWRVGGVGGLARLAAYCYELVATYGSNDDEHETA